SRDRPGPDPADTTTTTRILLLRAGLAPFGVKQMLDDARMAVDREPPGSVWHPGAAMLLGVAQLLNGNPEAARGSLERAAQLGRERQRGSASFALAQLSLIAAGQDDWAVAEACANEAMDLVQAGQLGEYPLTIAAYAARARLALHARDIAQAR